MRKNYWDIPYQHMFRCDNDATQRYKKQQPFLGTVTVQAAAAIFTRCVKSLTTGHVGREDGLTQDHVRSWRRGGRRLIPRNTFGHQIVQVCVRLLIQSLKLLHVVEMQLPTLPAKAGLMLDTWVRYWSMSSVPPHGHLAIQCPWFRPNFMHQ